MRKLAVRNLFRKKEVGGYMCMHMCSTYIYVQSNPYALCIVVCFAYGVVASFAFRLVILFLFFSTFLIGRADRVLNTRSKRSEILRAVMHFWVAL